MNTYALIDSNNFVSQVIVLPEDQLHRAEEFIAADLGIPGIWLACSVNSWRGKNRDGTPGKAFRKNYPKPGWYYDAATDSFLEPKPTQYPSWILDADGGFWKPPVPRPGVRPTDGNVYKWDEATVSWIQVPR